MSAFDSYLDRVKKWLGRELDPAELIEAIDLYNGGWHPRRTAAYFAERSNADAEPGPADALSDQPAASGDI